MSRRLPSRLAARSDLRTEIQDAQDVELELNPAEIAELRRSIDGVRRLVERRSLACQGVEEEADEIDLQRDPFDESARRTCFGGSFGGPRRRQAPLFVAWMRRCNRAAANLLDEKPICVPVDGTQGFDPDGLLELIDELERRLDVLSRIH